MKKMLTTTLMVALLAACKTKNPTPAVEKSAPGTMETKAATTSEFTAAMVANKKDPICGMPVTAGISDTSHYEGKSYGFCSSECKDEFKKTPLAYLKEME